MGSTTALRRRQKSVGEVRAGDWLGFTAVIALNSVQAPAKQNSGRLSSSANQTASFFVLEFVRGAFSGKVFHRHQRFSGLSRPRQRGDVLRMLVTADPPVVGGRDMPRRKIAGVPKIQRQSSWKGPTTINEVTNESTEASPAANV
jgi:hypothetical protein